MSNPIDINDDEDVTKGSKRDLGHRAVVVLCAACLGLLVLDVAFLLPIEHYEKHPYFPWEAKPGFYGAIGFVSCLILAFGAKWILRPLVKREEDCDV